MLKRMCGIFTASAIFFIAANAMAQDKDLPKGAWWTEPIVVKALNLNDSEQEQLEKAFGKYLAKKLNLKKSGAD
jgi:hypothetical protein